ncbi:MULTISPECIES: Holliday junction branch migration DNA helicase RuvB [unclassified Campylobacter]|uniref:Holliday junction branch migration DNA helicase RuvB n=1 Tax=unclassified Campylobacter TaxID=2593542 RepID=UPI001237E5B0|nr:MULTISPECIES: Holliday junction branch migration DNA helicase RuvB [unclassified Campylobacter]KAA6224776.1 Holliday junction branch migration DNA helicase RuvB [Campylobacter sp. LR185c]KAA6227351.1 Holliday junction branch migration DNA helicase RuvB [Campylobacter sp. LR196d]KAA6228728.1 Holliday junction branch migration DNA helicase RuvB [Campylobacter sp. LR286c]KAA6229538.1 Holliday junction branch migration DNA helicase RuvB [Campylobacter sp. LR264d]KAA8604903.1 Holliday junction b
MDKIVEIEKFSFDEKYENSLRPTSFDDYIGQENIKKNLNVFISAAKKREENLDHILFSGPAGLGKTTLANIISYEMTANIKTTAAPMIEKSGDLAAILTNLSEGDILFIDEIHRLSPAIEEVLYPAMEDFRLDIIIGSGPAAQTIKIDLPKFTLIGATTRAGKLSNPLRDRFGMQFRLEFYKDEELATIIQKAAVKLNKTCDKNAAMEIAKRSRSTPRIALRLLRRVRDFADVNDEETITQQRTIEALNSLGVNELGFDSMDLKYLELLTTSRGRPIGLGSLAAALSEDENTIEDVIEPYLLANGYIERTAKGRIASVKSYKALKLNYERTLFDEE